MSTLVRRTLVLLILALVVAGLGGFTVAANTKGLMLQSAQMSVGMPGMECEREVPTMPCGGQLGCNIPCSAPAVDLPVPIGLQHETPALAASPKLIPPFPAATAPSLATPPPRSTHIA